MGTRALASVHTLKLAFTQALVLTHFDLANPIAIETDASDYTIAAMPLFPRSLPMTVTCTQLLFTLVG